MQTYLNKNSNFFERILQLIDFYNIKSINVLAKDYLNYNSSEKINRLKKENTSPSFEIIQDISNKFENINLDWLVNGKGEMLKNPEKVSSNILAEPSVNYQRVKNGVDEICEKCAVLEKDNQRLTEIIKLKDELLEMYRPKLGDKKAG